MRAEPVPLCTRHPAPRTLQAGDSFAGAFYELGLARAGSRAAPSPPTAEVTTSELAGLTSPHGSSSAERELARRLGMRAGSPWAWGAPAVATVPKRLRTALQDPRQLFDNGDRYLPAVPPYTHTHVCMCICMCMRRASCMSRAHVHVRVAGAHIHMHVHVHVHVRVHVHVHVHMHACGRLRP